ncbi:bacillithiol system protein YtxJ [Arachidicoccus ginsenosidimutans]|uniref:bacillithiol system redox-active protein YtxJ n=1 Tax=Arachidicoccus sp. BS20 TaxID=1850526 RepID=UPI0007F1813E|nr:bacillithiol system redox-active protein YtxJ [Arachidicoccus sp. BS20]ANI89513.1 bacillithiol system protein YtxJ [Arachidicoccus sp. BS20]
MNWIELINVVQLNDIKEKSFAKTQIIYKHSTTCSISRMVEARLNNSKENIDADFYYLDLLTHRDVSTAIAEMFGVQHESPQILVIKNGVCTYHESHTAIQIFEIAEQV